MKCENTKNHPKLDNTWVTDGMRVGPRQAILFFILLNAKEGLSYQTQSSVTDKTRGEKTDRKAAIKV